MYGGADYDDFLPFNSYVDVRKFSSVSDLGHYLQFLSKNQHAYDRYFNWMNFAKVLNTSEAVKKSYCDLCETLNKLRYREERVGNIDKWFNGKAKCYKIVK